MSSHDFVNVHNHISFTVQLEFGVRGLFNKLAQLRNYLSISLPNVCQTFADTSLHHVVVEVNQFVKLINHPRSQVLTLLTNLRQTRNHSSLVFNV